MNFAVAAVTAVVVLEALPAAPATDVETEVVAAALVDTPEAGAGSGTAASVMVTGSTVVDTGLEERVE